MASIGKHIMYIENRNGNTNVQFQQAATLKGAYELLQSKDVLIDKSRMDCGSFTKEIIDTAEANCNGFYIRVQRCSYVQEFLSNYPGETIEKNLLGTTKFPAQKIHLPVCDRAIQMDPTRKTEDPYTIHEKIATSDSRIHRKANGTLWGKGMPIYQL